jgi:hypothetical protein
MSIWASMSIARDHDVATLKNVSPHGAGNATYLKKIAGALGCSIEDLVRDARSLERAGQIELLRLWSLLPDDAARMQVLETARILASARGPGPAEVQARADGAQAGSRPSGE